MNHDETDLISKANRRRLRDEIRARRRAMSDTKRQLASTHICQRFADLPSFQAASRLAGYLAFDGEADPLQLMSFAVHQNKNVFVPIIIGKDKPLLFAPWKPNVPMKKNSFGIEEPDVPRSQWVTAEQLDLVVTPLVAFDDQGTRLGVGGGYYDRSFEFLNQLIPTKPRPTILIGFAFELQRVPLMERQPWDVRLDGVVTERQP